MAHAAAIEVAGLSLWYPRQEPVLTKVDFQLNDGEYVGLSGASGSGKTTFLRVLAGLHGLEAGLSAEGRAFARVGVDPTRTDPPSDSVDLIADTQRAQFGRARFRKTSVAWVTEQARSAFHPTRTIAETWARQFEPGELLAVLEQLGLDEPVRIAASLPYQLSGGEAQRVQFAFARAKDAPLLLCESPTFGLDAISAARVIGLLRADHAAGRTVMHVDHDRRLLDALAGRRVHLQGQALLPFAAPGHAEARPQQGTAHTSGAACVRVRGLRVAYGDLPVLHGVDLDLYAGEMLVVTGASGNGKTTLGRALAKHVVATGAYEIRRPAALLTAQTGAGAWRDVGFARGPFGKTLPEVQYVYQDPRSSLNPALNVDSTLRAHGASTTAAVRELLDAVRLSPELARRAVLSLSTGQMQRLAIARALATQPSVLICDEITSALDVETAEEILEGLKRLREGRNLTIVYITHDLALAREQASRVLCLEKGMVAEVSEASAFFTRPRSEVGRELLAAASKLYDNPAPGSSSR